MSTQVDAHVLVGYNNKVLSFPDAKDNALLLDSWTEQTDNKILADKEID